MSELENQEMRCKHLPGPCMLGKEPTADHCFFCLIIVVKESLDAASDPESTDRSVGYLLSRAKYALVALEDWAKKLGHKQPDEPAREPKRRSDKLIV